MQWKNCDEKFKDFSSSCNIILNEQSPQKKNYVRGNQLTFMNKTYENFAKV